VYSFVDRVHNSYDGVMSRGLQEFDHKIDTEHVPPFVWNREWLELANRRVSPRLRLEAEVAGTCKGIALSPHLNCKVILQSSLSLFKYY